MRNYTFEDIFLQFTQLFEVEILPFQFGCFQKNSVVSACPRLENTMEWIGTIRGGEGTVKTLIVFLPTTL